MPPFPNANGSADTSGEEGKAFHEGNCHLDAQPPAEINGLSSSNRVDQKPSANKSQPSRTDHHSNGEEWYCLRSLPKQEHIATANLKGMISGIDVFCPRLRIRRRCHRGAVWFVEALFPGYLFARFNPDTSMQAVKFVPGVKSVVSFGLFTVTIRNEIIEELRTDFDHNELHEVPDDPRPGDEVTITAGPFHGLRANVLKLLPATDRVQLLLELLGRSMPVEVARDYVITQKPVSQLLTDQKARLALAGQGSRHQSYVNAIT